jgi:hypothetical protein
MRKSLAVAAMLGLFAAPVSAQTIVYLNFDDQADGALGAADHDPYALGAGEIGTVLPAPFDNLNLDFTIKVRGDNPPTIAATPGFPGVAQGGKSMLLTPSSGGGVAGLRIESDNGIPPRSFTMEAIWWTTDPAGTGMTAGVQSIIGSEPTGGQERAGFFIRTVGAVPGRMDYWTDRGDSNAECVLKNNFIPANTLIHDVMVFDYNEGDPSQSRIRAYRNGVLLANDNATFNGQTNILYTATGAPTALFGARGRLVSDPVEVGGRRFFGIGYNTTNDPDGDPRGLIGGIDAVAITLGALEPEDFVLPGGDVIPFPPPLLIELESFSASAPGVGQLATIEWSTSSEIDNVGFNVRRIRFQDGVPSPAGQVNAALIPAEGTASQGASYSLVDPLPVAPGERRGYVLVDIDANGTATRHGPIPLQVEGQPSGEPSWSLY